MRILILIVSLAVTLFSLAASARAVNCQTTCGGRNADGSQQCWTNCN